MLYNLISWVVFGLVAGVLAKLLMPGKDPGGCIVTSVLGIAGAVVGGFLAHFFKLAGDSGKFGDRGFLMRLIFAVVGAVILLAIYRLITNKRQ
jgi:uncharacterized membrane protein YeaQ/YmgE (transglycosylase-associated protein family)